MKKRNDVTPAKDLPGKPATDLTPGPAPDPEDEGRPIDDVKGQAIQPTDPAVPTALDDDEGGADPIDPDTGRPYDNIDAGTDIPKAGRKGGRDQS